MDIDLNALKTGLLIAVAAFAPHLYEPASKAFDVAIEGYKVSQEKDFFRLTADLNIIFANIKAGKLEVLS